MSKATISTITVTHHAQKPEYQWEIVIPEGPTVLLPESAIDQALHILGPAAESSEVRQQILALPDAASRSVDAELRPAAISALAALGKAKMM